MLGTLNTKFQALVNMTSGQTVALHCVYFMAYFCGPPAFSYYLPAYQIWFQNHHHYRIMYICNRVSGLLAICDFGIVLGIIVSNYIATLGLSTLQISANPFIILCGLSQRPEGRQNLAQALRGVGSVAALLLSNLILFQKTRISSPVDAQWTYLAVAMFSIALAGFFYYYPLPEVTMNELENTWGLTAAPPSIQSAGLSISVPAFTMIAAAAAQCVSLGARETISPMTSALISQWLEHVSNSQVFCYS
jgi:hypothetical protein